jgi:homoserine O-succinyltransferase/O-acetyltransferase
MTLILPKHLPAASSLAAEGAVCLDRETAALRLGERPLEVLLINLMPDKPRTELQFARLLAASGQPVALSLAVPASHDVKGTPASHLRRFYRPWPDYIARSFDGVIVTGAPVEHLPFDAVDYWHELQAIIDWTSASAGRSLFVCWAAQAALHHRYGVPKHTLAEKLSGVYRQQILSDLPLLDGLGDGIVMPVSRHTEVRDADLPARAGLTIAARSDVSGLALVEDAVHGASYLFNHPEYDATTLAGEYERDSALGRPVRLPADYFPSDDPRRAPLATWRPAAERLYRNWVSELARERDRRNITVWFHALGLPAAAACRA